jgi:hypothetical protein
VACGERIGVYERIWHTRPAQGAELTSWLRLTSDADAPLGGFWHAECAEAGGLPGG